MWDAFEESKIGWNNKQPERWIDVKVWKKNSDAGRYIAMQ